jgi:hypothetical protein
VAMVVVSTVIVGVGMATVTEVSATVATGVIGRVGAVCRAHPGPSTSIIRARTIIKTGDLFIRASLHYNVEQTSSCDEQ